MRHFFTYDSIIINDFISLPQVFFGQAIALHQVMKKIIVVSRCLKILKKEPQVAEFSFKGHYSGHQIKSLLITQMNQSWEKSEDYVIYLMVTEIINARLIGKALKIKKISDFMMED